MVGTQAYTWGESHEGETVSGVLVPRDKGWPNATASELEEVSLTILPPHLVFAGLPSPS